MLEHLPSMHGALDPILKSPSTKINLKKPISSFMTSERKMSAGLLECLWSSINPQASCRFPIHSIRPQPREAESRAVG